MALRSSYLFTSFPIISPVVFYVEAACPPPWRQLHRISPPFRSLASQTWTNFRQNSSPVFCGSLGSAAAAGRIFLDLESNGGGEGVGGGGAGERGLPLAGVFRPARATPPGSLSVRRTTRWLSSATIVPRRPASGFRRGSHEPNNSPLFALLRARAVCIPPVYKFSLLAENYRNLETPPRRLSSQAFAPLSARSSWRFTIDWPLELSPFPFLARGESNFKMAGWFSSAITSFKFETSTCCSSSVLGSREGWFREFPIRSCSYGD